ncbi:MAG: hypothetical protein ACTHKT_12475 [Solirubrobacterales bacterium]
MGEVYAHDMNEQEAKERCEQLAAEHPDCATHRWVPFEGKDGEWYVAKTNLPPAVKPTGTATRATPRPDPDDPRQLPPWLDPPRGGLV